MFIVRAAISTAIKVLTKETKSFLPEVWFFFHTLLESENNVFNNFLRSVRERHLFKKKLCTRVKSLPQSKEIKRILQ